MRGNERLPTVSIIDTLADDNEFPAYGVPPSPAPPIGYGAGPGHPSPFSFADHSIQAYLLPPFGAYPMSRTLANPALYPPLAVPATPEPRDELEREEKRARDTARERERQLREDGPPPSPGKRTMYGSEMERLEGRFGDYTRWD